MSADCFCSAARGIRRIRNGNAEWTCVTTGGMGLTVGVAGPLGCQLSVRKNRGSSFARRTCLLYSYVKGKT